MASPFDDLTDDEFERLAAPPAPGPAPAPLPATTPDLTSVASLSDTDFEAFAAPAAPEPALPAPAPEPALPEGPPPGMAAFADKQGNVTYVPEGEASIARAHGLVPLADLREKERQAALQAEHGGLGSQALTFGEALGRGATFGATDVLSEAASALAAELGGPDVVRAAGRGLGAGVSTENTFERAYREAREDIRARREANPITGTLGEITGAVAPTLLGGGTGALAKVAAAAPASLASKAGLGAAAKIAGTAPGVLRAAGAGLVGGALEGGLAAGGLATSEAVPELVKDPGLAAQHILTATSEGGLIGGIFGGILGGVGRALTKGGAAATELGEKGAMKLEDIGEGLRAKPANDVVPPVTADTMEEVVYNLEAKPSALTAEELAAQDTRKALARSIDEERALQGGFEDAVQGSTRDIRADMDDVLRGANKVDEYAGIAAKRRANEIAASELKDVPSGAFEQLPLTAEEQAAARAAQPGEAFDSGVVRSTKDGEQWFHVPESADAPGTAETPGLRGRARLGMSEPGLATVDFINARKRGAGVGSKLYAEMADFAEENGRKLASGTSDSRTEWASAWWNKRVKEGVATFDEARDRYVLTGRIRGQRPVTAEAPLPTTRQRELSTREVNARAAIHAIRDELQTFRAGLSDVEAKGLGPFMKHLDHEIPLIEDAFRRGDIGEAYHRMDQGIKGAMGRMRKNVPEWTKNKIEELYPTLQKHLEDIEQYGSLAERQRAVNPHWSKRIGQSLDSAWQRFTSVAGERAANEWDQLFLSDPGAIKGLLTNLGDAGSARVEESFRQNLRAMARDAVERAKAWGGKELQNEAERMVDRVARIERRLDATAAIRRDYLAAQQKAGLSSTQDLAASALGVVSPRAAFAITGTAQAKRKVLAAAAEAGTDVGSKVAKNAGRLVRQATSGFGKALRGAGTVAETGVGVAPGAAATVAGGGPESVARELITEKKKERAVQESQALLDPRSPEARDLIQRALIVADEQPELAQAMVSLELQRAQLIQSLLPKPMPGLFAPEPRLDPTRARRLERTISAAYYPERTLRRLADGTATKEEVGTIKSLFPGVYQEFVSTVEQQLASSKKPVPRQAQQRIHMMTGIVTRPALDPTALQKQQAVAQAGNVPEDKGGPQPTGGGKPYRMDPDRYSTKADRMMAQ